MTSSSSGNLLLCAVGVALLLRHCLCDVIGDVIVNTRYGRVRGRRVHRDYGLGQGMHIHTIFAYICIMILAHVAT